MRLSATPFSFTVSRSFWSDIVILDTDCCISPSRVTLNLYMLSAPSRATWAHTAADITIIPWRISFFLKRHMCIISTVPASQQITPVTADCIIYSLR